MRAALVVGCTAATALITLGFGSHHRLEARAAPAPGTFAPPPDSAIPKGEFGDEVRLGEQIFCDPGRYATTFVGNDLKCSNCHLDAGRLAGSAPMWAAYVSYPAFRKKNGHVNSFQERLQGCFRYSMNGKAPALGDPVLVALETYSYFLAKGLPTGESAPGGGYPALWGPRSFNWGAGMASIKNAAAFIHANMPLGRGGSLTPQQAWDVATYVDSQVRPQDPRFTGDVQATRETFHKTPFSMYGQTVNGAVLGDPAFTPPAGTVPPAADAK